MSGSHKCARPRKTQTRRPFAGCKQTGSCAHCTASCDGDGILGLLGLLRARYGGLGMLMVRKLTRSGTGEFVARLQGIEESSTWGKNFVRIFVNRRLLYVSFLGSYIIRQYVGAPYPDCSGASYEPYTLYNSSHNRS